MAARENGGTVVGGLYGGAGWRLVVPVLALGLHGCGSGIPSGWECSGESDGCHEGEVCRSFEGGTPKCYSVCKNAWDCPAGEGCSEDDPSGVCLPYSAPCEEHESCWAGFFCSGSESRQCVKCGDNGRATDCRGPSAPENLSAEAGAASVNVTWDAVSGAEGYDLYWSTSADVTVASNRIADVSNPYLHSELTNGTTYYYAVVAYDAKGVSAFSTLAFDTVDLAAPAWIIAGAGDGQVTIDWASVADASGYDLYWGTGADVFVSGARVEDVSAPYVRTPLTNGTGYYFGVIGYNAGGNGQTSTVAQATPSATPPAAGLGEWCNDATVLCDTGLKCDNAICCDAIASTCCSASIEATVCGGELACDVYDDTPSFECFEACVPYTSNECLGQEAEYCLTNGSSCAEKLTDGEQCRDEAGQCASDHCIDDVCCGGACDGLCMACSTAKSGGSNGECTPIPALFDPDDDCPATAAGCDGAGACKTGAKRLSTDPQEYDYFGATVALDGDYAIVGAPGEDGGSGDPLSGAGAAYIFHRVGGWGGTKIVAMGPEYGAKFGSSVAIGGNYAVVGAPREYYNVGAVYVYHRTGTNSWDDAMKLTASDAGIDLFGTSVAISGDYIVVGAPTEDSGGDNAGAAYVFFRTGPNTWDDGTKVYATDPGAGDRFGGSVAIDGDYVLVGAAWEDGGDGDPASDAGAAYVFRRTGTNTWDGGTKFVAPDPKRYARFGSAVAIDGDYALVGAPWEGGEQGSNEGAAYVFRRTGTNSWDDGTELVAVDPGYEDKFGSSVGISGDRAIVGARGEDGGAGNPLSGAGAACVFRRTGNNAWSDGRKTVAPDAAEHDSFGGAVAISGERIVVGATGEDGNNDLLPAAGAAYIF